jgi:peptide/nickel transport system substrate-binding protein
MQGWLREFTIDLGNGELFHPYDTEAPQRLADYVEARGYTISENLDFNSVFGYGWWKYAPDEAAKLLEKNGFTQDKGGKWLLPDGTPWQITILTSVVAGSPGYQNAFAAAHEWRKFGIDVTVLTSEAIQSLSENGEFDVTTEWPVYEAWGGHIDMYRSFDPFNSAYLQPILGEPNYGHDSRWTDPRMDEVINKLKNTDWNDDERIAELGIEGFKILVEEMPTIATFSIPGTIANDTYYWANWPSIDNDYVMPFHHWPNFKYMLPFLEPTGR